MLKHVRAFSQTLFHRRNAIALEAKSSKMDLSFILNLFDFESTSAIIVYSCELRVCARVRVCVCVCETSLIPFILHTMHTNKR